jgi:hypothetical protein
MKEVPERVPVESRRMLDAAQAALPVVVARVLISIRTPLHSPFSCA